MTAISAQSRRAVYLCVCPRGIISRLRSTSLASHASCRLSQLRRSLQLQRPPHRGIQRRAMAPIVRTAVPKTVKAAEASDNNAKSTRTSSSSSSRAKDESAAKRTPVSRTSTPTGSSGAAGSTSSKARTSSASSTASRAGTSLSSKEPAQPQTKTSARKDAKTSPAVTPANSNNVAAPQPQDAAKPTRAALPLPSATLHKHKQAAVFNSGKKRHKTSV